MLPKRRRLDVKEVAEVLKLGRSLSATHLSMKFLTKLTDFKVSVVAPKSLARKAILRNRLRRAVYRAIEPLPPLRGHAILFIRTIPNGKKLTPAFVEDIKILLKKI